VKARKGTRRAAPGEGPQGPGSGRVVRWRPVVVTFALILAVLAAYWPAIHNGFITSFDDNEYVTQNRWVCGGLRPQGVAWAFTSFDASNWHPLTWLSHMLDVELFGLNPAGHHLVNVLLHAATTALLFRVLSLAGGALWPSALVAAVFGLHPLHVESVAWVAERKDVLSTLFLALALLAYVGYQRRRSRRGYALVVLAFAAGLMAKPMLVSLPFLLLLLDAWPLGRSGSGRRAPGATLATWTPLVREKWPLFALATLSCVVTFLAQARGGTVSSLDAIPLAARVGNALNSYAIYLFKTLWPADLAIYYPYPPDGVPAWQLLLAAVLLAVVTAAVLLGGKTRPFLRLGWFWYLITLVPVIGLVQVGSQSMADRYMYVPLIGLAIMAAWGAAGAPGRTRLLAAAFVLILPPLLLLTRSQVGLWKDSDTVFRHAVQVTSGNWLAHYNLGVTAAQQGRPDEAIEHYLQALRAKPSMVGAHVNLGALFWGQGRGADAVGQFYEALRYDPLNVTAHVNLGVDLSVLGRSDEAALHYEEALRIDPDNSQARNNLRWLRPGAPR